MSAILLLGGGGHCKACIDVIEQEAKFRVAGIVQSDSGGGDALFNYPILGVDDDLQKLLRNIPFAMVTVGQIKSPRIRIRLFGLLKEYGAVLPIIKSPKSYCSPRANFGEGTIVLHGGVVNANANIGRNCIINSQALVEHDVEISDHCHVSTGALINGGVRIGQGCFIGSGSVLREGIRIGENSVIGAGCFVASDVPARTLLKGNTWIAER